MSWRRIDENTYIDDTLVTCAEYQLFIDEMHEQGKYYQPDHWTSCQFPKGQAREPILGARYADAVDFCRWLTFHDANEWMYRLPREKEFNTMSNESCAQSQYGGWVISTKYSFSWIGSVPLNARMLDIALDLNFSSEETVVREMFYAQKRAQSRVLNLGWGFPVDFSTIPTLDDTTVTKIGFDLFRELDLDRDRILDRDITFSHAINLTRDLAQVQINYNVDIKKTLDFYIDILTLRERIQGRSPAFEGIRLVKERIR